MKKFQQFFLLASLAAGAACASDMQDFSAYWNKSYRADSLILDNPMIPAQIAVSRFIYNDVTKEIDNLAKKFKCSEQNVTSDSFAVYNCDFSSDMPDVRQNVYGRFVKKLDNGSLFTQVYALTPNPSDKEVERMAKHLLNEDPIANPLDEWIVSSYETDNAEAQQTGVLYENKKRQGYISSSIGIYTDTDKFKYLDNLGKLLLCKKAERLDNGVNFSECSTYHYYELRDLVFPYYVLTSISSDLLNDEESMKFMRRLADDAYRYNKKQLDEHMHK